MKNFYTALISCFVLVGLLLGAGIWLGNEFGQASESWLAVASKLDKFVDVLEDERVTGIERETVNRNNLISGENYIFINGESKNGVKCSFDVDGVITLDGKCAQPFVICLGERVILEKGYYTISVQGDAPARRNCSIELKTTDAEGKTVSLQKTDFATPLTFYCDGLQYVDVFLGVGYGEAFNAYAVKPVLVSGEKMQTFYVTETIPLG